MDATGHRGARLEILGGKVRFSEKSVYVSVTIHPNVGGYVGADEFAPTLLIRILYFLHRVNRWRSHFSHVSKNLPYIDKRNLATLWRLNVTSKSPLILLPY